MPLDNGTAPVGAQITDYAQQVAALNRQIDALSKGGLLPSEGADKQTYDALKQKRDSIASKAYDLVQRAKKAGAAPPDFVAETKKAAQGMKPPKALGLVPAVKTADGLAVGAPGDNHDTVVPNAPEKNRGFVHQNKPGEFLTREEAAKKTPGVAGQAVQSKSTPDSLSSEDLNRARGLPERKPEGEAKTTLAEIRVKYPQYADLSDQKLADALHDKFYKDMPREQFYAKIAFSPTATAPKGKPKQIVGVKTPPMQTMFKPPTHEGPSIAESEAALEKLRKDKVPHTDPRWEKAYRDRYYAYGRSESSNLGLFAGGEAIGGDIAKGVAKGAQRVGSGITDLIKRALGTEQKAAISGVRGAAIKRAAGTATSEEQAAAEAQAKAAKIGKTQEEVQAKQPAVAAQRAEAVTKPPAMGQVPGLEKERVVERTRAEVAALEKQYREAGASAEEARTAAETHQAKAQDAEAAVDKLEKDLLAKPGTTAEQFGTALRNTTQQLQEKYARIRAKEAGYGKALDDAGDELRVDTKGAQDQIDHYLKDIRNPALKRVLEGMKGLLATEKDEVAHDALSVRAADSLRGYLDSVIQSKMFGDQKIDRETLFVVKQIKRELVKSATEAWTPYRDALAKWSTLSRPLNIVERKGALRKVLETDPVSTDYALTEAQVVGRIVSQAKAGNPTFTRLVAENPDLRDAARLYFTQDLFGKEVVPTEAALRTWLKDNETPLRQLGLYDEFRSIRAARETAQRAVDEATGAAKESMAQAKQAEKNEAEVKRQLGRAQGVREQAKKRLAESQKTKPTAEELKAASAKRAEAGVKRLEQRKGEAVKAAEKHEGAADTYRRFETELSSSVDKAVVPKARDFVGKLRRDGKIDDKTYGEALKQINEAEKTIHKTHQLRVKLSAIALVAALSTGGYEAWRNLRLLLFPH